MYGAQTWMLTRQIINKPWTIQRAIQIAMFGITVRGKELKDQM